MQTSGDMAAEHYDLVETRIGAIGIAWSGSGVTRVQLPEADREATEVLLAKGGRRAPASNPPSFILDLAELLARYAGGERVDFDHLPLDLARARPFDLPVWRACRELAWGQAVTYGELTRRLGSPYVATAVGQALGRNPVPIIVPCHRVVAAGGRIGGFSAPGGAATKSRLLTLEGIEIGPPTPPSAELPPLLELMQRP